MKGLVYVIFILIGFNNAEAQFRISGKVTDILGVPLDGVSIMERGTSNGTVTDVEGNYFLQVKTGESVLLFSYVGFDTEEVLIRNKSVIDLIMLPDLTQLMEIEVVGTRSMNRSAVETPVPVDIIPLSKVANSYGQLDLNQMLQYMVPAYNANQQSGADGADHVDPASIRGLGPDQVLVLVNGKRRHQSSLINIFGVRGRGNTGTDLNTIPVAAIDRIEILRDGASAQYGSDAIAGVVNVVLKSGVKKYTGAVNTGIYHEGDGQSLQVNGNYGFKIGDAGFINMTMDYLHKGRTNRPADENKYDIYRRKFGGAESDNFSVYMNGELPVNYQTKFYSFAGYNFRNSDAYAWTRFADDNRNIKSIYPDGFDPRILTYIVDKSLSTGVKTELAGWNIDFNNTFGQNAFNYRVAGSLNASLLEQSPTYFDAGGFKLSQNTTSMHFTRYNPDWAQGANIAFGAEYRIENYKILAGEEASWRNYGLVDTVLNGTIVPWDVLNKPGGSQGFPGFRPENEVDEFRTNFAGYFDVEVDLNAVFMIEAALRGERYSDFGNALNGKLAFRYEWVKNLALRGSFSTGFRAPSLAQIYFNSVITDYVAGAAQDKLIAKNNSPITRALGIPGLKQEKSLNYSIGLAYMPSGNFSVTIDGYYVNVWDRIILTGAFEDDDPEIGDELMEQNVGAAQFFTNAVDTKTFGLDLIAQHTAALWKGKLKTTLAANINHMTLENVKTNDRLHGKEDIYFDKREKYFLLASAPASKVNFTMDYTVKKMGVNLRLIRFDEVVLIDWLGTEDVYDPRIVTDISISYRLGSYLNITTGAANVFNVQPSLQDTETESGGNWDPVQMGYNGAFYFLKCGIML